MIKMSAYFIFSFLVLIAAASTHAADKPQGPTDVVGKNEFVNYCASCHGSDGKGNGPIVHFLKRKPKDLTQLTKENSNVFPFERIWGVFDGTYTMTEHGSSEMPIWGYQFVREAQLENEPNTTAKAKALDIILYIQVIQE
jgi:mono/diheme cytochrome c family protein